MTETMKSIHDGTLGEINITTGVLETIAAQAVREVKGVYQLHTTVPKEVGNLFRLDSARGGAKVHRDGANIHIDVNVDILYGHSVPEVALAVQTRVKEQILFMTDLVVQAVNVHVVSVKPEHRESGDHRE